MSLDSAFLVMDENYNMPNTTRPTTPNPEVMIQHPNTGSYGPAPQTRLHTTALYDGRVPSPLDNNRNAEQQLGSMGAIQDYNPGSDVCALTSKHLLERMVAD